MNPSLLSALAALLSLTSTTLADMGALEGHRQRVLVSTDIGGTDPDDDQSLVHLLLYADVLDLEGLVASPYGQGRKKDILEVIEFYERDYGKLKSHSEKYPTPEALRAITKQGALQSPGATGVGEPTEGSDWIIKCARRDDPRPLHVLVWGGIEDLAQALHDAPDILPKLHVYYIGGPNKMWGVNAYNYIEQQHPTLWMIEANATYRGWFVGGNQSGEWGNKSFVAHHVARHGALGDYFATQLKGSIKMGDTPSVGWLLRGTPDEPTQPSWGGKFVKIWEGRKTIFTSLTTEADQTEAFGVVEFALPVPVGFSQQHTAKMLFDNRISAMATNADGVLRFLFSPRDAKVWSYVIESDFPALNGQRGSFTAIPPPLGKTKATSATHPHWWIDDPDPAATEGVHPGAKSVNQWRVDYLRDFAEHMERCKSPASSKPKSSR
jgi:hypothetical protein